jgi:AcrR family transcriptional regulator
VARTRSTAHPARPAPPHALTAARRHAPEPGPAQPARAGFVLYVGLQGDSPALDAAHAADLAEVAEALRDLARDLLPTAETYTALSLVPGTAAAQDEVQSLRARLGALRPLESAQEAAGEPPVAESA